MIAMQVKVDRPSLDRFLRGTKKDGEKNIKEYVNRAGRLVQSEAVARAPISPKQSQTSGNNKKSTAIDKQSPGGLERSIEFGTKDGGRTGAVFVAANSEAGSYAKKMHDGRGKQWENLGAGSIAKGGKVGGKFVDRAWSENIGRIEQIGKAIE